MSLDGDTSCTLVLTIKDPLQICLIQVRAKGLRIDS